MVTSLMMSFPGCDTGPDGDSEDVGAEHNRLVPHRRHQPELHQRRPQPELHQRRPEPLLLEPGPYIFKCRNLRILS
jgi:hypothetical protein